MKVDRTDERILREIVDNAKAPLRSIAKRLKVSFVTVLNRMRRLEKEGIIKKYTASINYEKLGYGVHVLIEIRISKGKLLELERKIARHPNVYAVYDTTGEYDATVLAKFRTTRKMDNFLKIIQTYDFVERTNTKLVLNTVKDNHIQL